MTGGHPGSDRLNDHAEGLLAPAEGAALEAHLAQCAVCRAEVEGIRRFRADAAALPRSIDPGVDLRPGVRAGRRRRAARGAVVPRRRLIAAAAALVIGVASALGSWWWVERASPGASAAAGSTGVVADASATVLALDREYARAGAELRESVEAASARLSPDAARLLRANIAAIERALAESRAALLEDPASPVLRELVLAAHRQRLDVLRQAAALVAES